MIGGGGAISWYNSSSGLFNYTTMVNGQNGKQQNPFPFPLPLFGLFLVCVLER
jgi:hypothetical protein